MAMTTGTGEGKLVSDINVTPMADVMLVLLIIFMVIGPMLEHGIKVPVPESRNAEQDANIESPTAAVVAITDEGNFYLNTEAVSPRGVPDKIHALLKDRPIQDQLVYIKAGRSVRYETVVSLVNSIREVGYDRIGLVSKKERESLVHN
jgi:biopolymer transport protein TolR